MIDIRNIDIATISKDEVFAIDTNVLTWTHYSKASDPHINKHPYQVFEYPNFISKLLLNGNNIVTTILNITELCNVIERNEFRIYKEINHKDKSFNIKEFRKIEAERILYKNEIEQMINEIKSSYDNQIKIIDIDSNVIDTYINQINSSQCDVFDFIVINHLKSLGIKNYISDDKDFNTVKDINFYSTTEI